MTAAGDEQAGAERSRAVALFRYSLIRGAADQPCQPGSEAAGPRAGRPRARRAVR